MISNKELLEAFVQASVRRQEVLMANKLFKAETVCGMNQLISKQEGILIKVTLHPQVQFSVRRNSSQQLLLREALNKYQFLKSSTNEGDYFDTYAYYSITQGYEFNCNSAKTLWKNWRAIKLLSDRMVKGSKLLVKKEQTWREVQDISVSNELMFIETADNTEELIHNLDDSILWLEEVS
ncbi:MAG: hypothetical protein AAFR58_05835 [Cyanobacteria bacterium J06627_28]